MYVYVCVQTCKLLWWSSLLAELSHSCRQVKHQPRYCVLFFEEGIKPLISPSYVGNGTATIPLQDFFLLGHVLK